MTFDAIESSCPAAPPGDRAATVLSSLLIAGLVISYLPQHVRIIINKSSEGFSSGFLLLGATSSASSLLNVIVLQRQEIACCSAWGRWTCIDNLLGVIQIAFQWLCFNLILVLFVIYFPERLRWHNHDYVLAEPPVTPDKRQVSLRKGPMDRGTMRTTYIVTYREHSDAFWQAHITAYAVLAHLLLFGGFTAFILEPGAPIAPHHARLRAHWATFLGILSSFLAAFQYLPQIRLTFERKLVGSLSIPMMLMQTPGSFVFVYSLAVRPHVNWTTWVVYAITGCLQGVLLVLCTLYKRRQRQLGIDDYGNLIRPPSPTSDGGDSSSISTRCSDSSRLSIQQQRPTERSPLFSRSNAA